jgi:methionyl-tRNA formyltransferase
LRTAYLGTSEFAATVLRRLADSPHAPALVVTPPDRPKGRGRHLSPPPAAKAATEIGLAVHQTESVNRRESAAALGAAKPEVVAVCAFGQLIKEPLLSDHLMLNVHPSLIPRWRGAAPIERTLMTGDERTGVTIMRVTEELDAGPVALQEAIAVQADDDYGSLSARLAELAGELLVRALDRLAESSLEFSEQDEALATYAEKIRPEERHLDPARPAEELERTVRALNPQIGTHLELDGGEWLRVRVAQAVAEGPPAGEIAVAGEQLLLGCGEEALRLDQVQPSGGRPMAAAEFLRGHAAPSRAV